METTTQELAVQRQNTALARQQDEFSPDEIALLKSTIAKGTSDLEFKLFLLICKETGLNPFAKQIYPMMRKDKNGVQQMTILTGIDGFRATADKTGLYAGSDDYLYDEGLTMYQHLQTGRGHPETATATVWKIVNGVMRPFTRTIAWKSYVPSPPQDFMWKKMDYLMPGKCAEALALRAAFPQQLSKVYEPAEMQQAMNDFVDYQETPRRPIKVVGEPHTSSAPQQHADATTEFPPKNIPTLERKMKAQGLPVVDEQGSPSTAGKLKNQKKDALLWRYWNQCEEATPAETPDPVINATQIEALADVVVTCGDLLGSGSDHGIAAITALNTPALQAELSNDHDILMVGECKQSWFDERMARYTSLLHELQSHIPAS